MTDAKLAPVPALILALSLALSGCGGGADEDAATSSVPQDTLAADGWEPVVAESRNTGDWADPDAFVHAEGRFRVYWPDHCHNFRTRLVGDAGSPEGLEAVHSFGVVEKDEESGVSIIVWFRETDGSAFTAESITRSLGIFIAEQGLTLKNQRPVMRLGMEGVIANMQNEETGFHYWTECYLYKGRTLMVSAWDRHGHMYEDPEVLRFFRSVEFID